jgi:hypothetical protein
MKVKFLLPLLILCIVLCFLAASLFIPSHFYHTAMLTGIESSYLNLKRPIPQTLKGGFLPPPIKPPEEKEVQTLWKNFHLKNFITPLPVHHPQIQMLPHLRRGQNKPFIGAKFVNQANSELFSFIDAKTFPFKYSIDKEKLYSLPVVKNIIVNKTIHEVWKDLFTKDLTPTKRGEHSVLSYAKKLIKTPLKELLYNLFIMHMRQYYFSNENILNLKFLEGKNIGIAQYDDLDERYMVEHLYFLRNGIVFHLIIRTKRNNITSKSIRNRFYHTVTFSETSVDSSLKIYSNYKILPYHRRIEQEGMIYLFAAWSHVSLRKEFLREMIQFLERGRDNIKRLTPLYEYAFQTFGNSFSMKDESLITEEEKLKMKMAEETEKELLKARDYSLNELEEKFSNPEDKIDYLLKKAKESGENIDLKEQRLER